MELKNINYIAIDNIFNRKAASLTFSLQNIKEEVYISNDSNKLIKGKSLLNILTLGLEKGKSFKISFNPSVEKEIRNIFKNYGREVI